MYRDVQLFIGGQWCDAQSGKTLAVIDPATEEEIGRVAHVGVADLEKAIIAVDTAFKIWRKTPALDRSGILRKAATLLRERADTIAPLMTAEQGKPLLEAKLEINASAEILEWCAEESRRTYGRIIPARADGVTAMAMKEPVGPVAAFTPWNFPMSQAVRKLAAVLAAGCSVIIKPPEETPASPAALVRALQDAGLPDGVVNLVYGVPAEISSYLIAHPVIRKVSFTGSTVVGKQLAELAGRHMKRITLELGGHAPAIVFEDADLEKAVSTLIEGKFRNAGQVCIAPTRILVQNRSYDDFVDHFTAETEKLKVGKGTEADVKIGALANGRRIEAMANLTEDAVWVGAELRTGGKRIGNKGHFFAPTILLDVPVTARAMNEEPFGPLAMISRFSTFEEVVAEANRLPYGLASYAFTGSVETSQRLAVEIEAGMLSINRYGLAFAELPFGGVKDSGYGSEGGIEAVDAYLATKFVSQAGA